MYTVTNHKKLKVNQNVKPVFDVANELHVFVVTFYLVHIARQVLRSAQYSGKWRIMSQRTTGKL